MKQPELEIIRFSCEDVIATSGDLLDQYVDPNLVDTGNENWS